MYSDKVVEMGVDEEERKATWLEDAESFTANAAIECARAVYEHLFAAMPSKVNIEH